MTGLQRYLVPLKHLFRQVEGGWSADKISVASFRAGQRDMFASGADRERRCKYRDIVATSPLTCRPHWTLTYWTILQFMKVPNSPIFFRQRCQIQLFTILWRLCQGLRKYTPLEFCWQCLTVTRQISHLYGKFSITSPEKAF